MNRRWQPPPMEVPGRPKLVVDSRAVRNMLRVNPDLRQGRTTAQVKAALEAGEPLILDPPASPSAATDARATPVDSPLQDTIDFFLSAKAERLATTLAEIDARRQQLDADERRARTELCDQVVTFVGLLDEGAMAEHGRSALGHHTELLARIGLTPDGLLNRAPRK